MLPLLLKVVLVVEELEEVEGVGEEQPPQVLQLLQLLRVSEGVGVLPPLEQQQPHFSHTMVESLMEGW